MGDWNVLQPPGRVLRLQSNNLTNETMANHAGVQGPRQKPFRDALRLEIAAAGTDDPKSLRAIARALMVKAASGDPVAIREFADRIDGKVAQPIAGEDGTGPVRIVHEVLWIALNGDGSSSTIDHESSSPGSTIVLNAGPSSSVIEGSVKLLPAPTI